MAALKKSAATHRMRAPDSGRAAGHAAANDDYGLAAGTPPWSSKPSLYVAEQWLIGSSPRWPRTGHPAGAACVQDG